MFHTMRRLLSFSAAWLLSQLLAPPLAFWGRWQERRVIRHAASRSLDSAELAFCQSIGLQQAEQVRILPIEPIPMPIPLWMIRIGERCGIGANVPLGMTLYRAIFTIPGLERHSLLIRHELVHVLQYQRLGGFRRFLRQYLTECLFHGYAHAPMEREARRLSENAH